MYGISTNCPYRNAGDHQILDNISIIVCGHKINEQYAWLRSLHLSYPSIPPGTSMTQDTESITHGGDEVFGS